MTQADSSIPDLKSKSKPILFVLLGLAVVLLVGGVIVFFVLPKDKIDPAPAMCAHIERQVEMEPEPWENFVDALVKVVEERIVSKTENVPIKIQSTSRRDRCTETMRKLERSLAEERYEALAQCIGGSGKATRATRCLDYVQQ